jgi:phage head maturation protease
MRTTTYWVFWQTTTAKYAADYETEAGARTCVDAVRARGDEVTGLERHDPSPHHTRYDVTTLPLDPER